MIVSKLPNIKKLDTLVITKVELDAVNSQKKIVKEKNLTSIIDTLWEHTTKKAKNDLPGKDSLEK